MRWSHLPWVLARHKARQFENLKRRAWNIMMCQHQFDVTGKCLTCGIDDRTWRAMPERMACERKMNELIKLLKSKVIR